MILYILYRIGFFIAMVLPLKVSYGIASFIAAAIYRFSKKDREAVTNNLRLVVGNNVEAKELERMAKEVFENFSKYLVDFFRSSKVDNDYIKRFVRLEGLHNIDEALSKGKGAIMLSAHIGNWELGGSVLSTAGYPLSAVVLTHQNKRINDFFTRQRLAGKMTPIEIGITLRSCFKVLKTNGLLALLGDRDFSNNGISAEFFGMKTRIPRGPAMLSCKLGSAIVPSFMIREKDDTFTLNFEKPIYPGDCEYSEESVLALTKICLAVIEDYVKRYPTQWYMFRDIRNNNGTKDLRPDTII